MGRNDKGPIAGPRVELGVGAASYMDGLVLRQRSQVDADYTYGMEMSRGLLKPPFRHLLRPVHRLYVSRSVS